MTLHRNVRDFARLAASCQLAISSAGGTALELAFVGIPQVLVSLVPDQRANAAYLAERGAAVNIGPFASGVSGEAWRAISRLLEDEQRRRTIGQRGCRLVDGGGAQRCATAMLQAWNARRRSST